MPRNGTPARIRSSKRLAHMHRVERPHHLAEVAHARQNDLRRALQARRIAHQFIRRANLSSVFSHRAQIAGAVVEDRDHSSPLVDGSCPSGARRSNRRSASLAQSI